MPALIDSHPFPARPFTHRQPPARRRARWLPALALSALALLALPARAQTVALSFDDGLNPLTEPRAAQWNAQILAHLQAEGVRAMVFPALVRTGGEAGLPLIAAWSQAGHAVGNHTASHRSLAAPDMTVQAFTADVLQADAALRALPTWVPRLRFPYLKEGETAAKRDGVRQWMHTHGYASAPVSIDASDWYYNRIYAAWLQRGDTDKAAQVRQRYVAHLLDRAAYYEQLARQALGRSPAHVMLLHTNQINADALREVIAALRARGWALVPTLQAFADPLYRHAPDTLPAGESVVWATAQAQGVAGLRYPAEDAVYEEPALRALGLLPD